MCHSGASSSEREVKQGRNFRNTSEHHLKGPQINASGQSQLVASRRSYPEVASHSEKRPAGSAIGTRDTSSDKGTATRDTSSDKADEKISSQIKQTNFFSDIKADEFHISSHLDSNTAAIVPRQENGIPKHDPYILRNSTSTNSASNTCINRNSEVKGSSTNFRVINGSMNDDYLPENNEARAVRKVETEAKSSFIQRRTFIENSLQLKWDAAPARNPGELSGRLLHLHVTPMRLQVGDEDPVLQAITENYNNFDHHDTATNNNEFFDQKADGRSTTVITDIGWTFHLYVKLCLQDFQTNNCVNKQKQSSHTEKNFSTTSKALVLPEVLHLGLPSNVYSNDYSSVELLFSSSMQKKSLIQEQYGLTTVLAISDESVVTASTRAFGGSTSTVALIAATSTSAGVPSTSNNDTAPRNTSTNMNTSLGTDGSPTKAPPRWRRTAVMPNDDCPDRLNYHVSPDGHRLSVFPNKNFRQVAANCRSGSNYFHAKHPNFRIYEDIAARDHLARMGGDTWGIT